MSTEVKQGPHLRYKKAWTILAALIATIVVAAGIVIVFFPGSVPIEPGKRAPIPATTSAPSPDASTELSKAFGPWSIVSNDTPSARIVLINQNGTVQMGSKAFKPSNKWEQSIAAEVVSSELRAQNVYIHTSNGFSYTLRLEQPFVFQARPQQVYAYNSKGQLVSTSINTIS